jgi:hypothetical protein
MNLIIQLACSERKTPMPPKKMNLIKIKLRTFQEIEILTAKTILISNPFSQIQSSLHLPYLPKKNR